MLGTRTNPNALSFTSMLEHKVLEQQYTMLLAVEPLYSFSPDFHHTQLKENIEAVVPSTSTGYKTCLIKNRSWHSIAGILARSRGGRMLRYVALSCFSFSKSWHFPYSIVGALNVSPGEALGPGIRIQIRHGKIRRYLHTILKIIILVVTGISKGHKHGEDLGVSGWRNSITGRSDSFLLYGRRFVSRLLLPVCKAQQEFVSRQRSNTGFP